MRLSCTFATSLATPEHIRIAERIGYERAWAYDSPALYPDVWAALSMAAERTERIGLGPAVLVPSLRHPMTNAGAISGLCALAPGRVAVAIGSGFTGRFTLGQRAMKWRDVEAYVRVLRALLAGETVEWEGAPIRMLHPTSCGVPRPIDVPILIGAAGPKGTEVAKAVGDGVFSAGVLNANAAFDWHALLQFGTVLEDGEDVDSERVALAAGPGVAVVYHSLYENGGPDAVRGFPGGEAWLAGIEDVPARERHLAIHEGHLVELSERDRRALAAGGHQLVRALSLTGTKAELRDRARAFAAAGVTELVIQPCGPDIAGELERFYDALH